jgi:hypothetical protein
MPYITVGAFMAAIMVLSGLATLILLPALLSWAGPWFFPEIRSAFAESIPQAANA